MSFADNEHTTNFLGAFTKSNSFPTPISWAFFILSLQILLLFQVFIFILSNIEIFFSLTPPEIIKDLCLLMVVVFITCSYQHKLLCSYYCFRQVHRQKSSNNHKNIYGNNQNCENGCSSYNYDKIDHISRNVRSF